MPGRLPSEFDNPLRAAGATPGVVNLLADVILPAAAIRRDLLAPPLLSAQERELFDRRPELGDPEYDTIVRDANQGSQPSLFWPDGGLLGDVTWAVNQATGARPELDELDPGGRGVDPLTGRTVFPINVELPSLNRQPGIIFIPAGLYPILGTIKLFGGQRLVGVPGIGGTTLIKYGDGACIQTQAPTDLAGDAFRSAADAFGLLRPEQRLDDLREAFDARWAQMNEATVPSPTVWLPEGADAAGPGVERRREYFEQSLATAEYKGYAMVSISDLAIEYRDWDEGGPEDRLVSRAPTLDELSDPFLVGGSTHQAGGLRPAALYATSVGIDLRGCSTSHIENVRVSGFFRGVGIQSRPRTGNGGSQVAYFNEIRHCDVTGCFVGFLMQHVLGLSYLSERAERTADNLNVGNLGPNSTSIYHCRIIAEAHEELSPRAGIELYGQTCSIVFCTIAVPETAVAAIVEYSSRNFSYRNQIRSGGRHLLRLPSTLYVRFDERKCDDPGTPAEDKCDDVNDDFGDVSRLHLKRRINPSGNHTFHLYNDYLSSDGAPSGPSLRTLAFPAKVPALLRNARLTNPGIEPRPDDAFPTTEEIRALRAREVDLLPFGQTLFVPYSDLDGSNLTQAPQSGWTSENLLMNTGFAGGLGTNEWKLETTKPIDERPELVRVRRLQEPLFTGMAVETVGGIDAQLVAHPLIISQPLVPRLGAADGLNLGENQVLWQSHGQLRGSRLVGGCWVYASHLDAVRLGFRVGNADRWGRYNWRANEWIFLTAIIDAADLSYPDWENQGEFFEDTDRRLTFLIDCTPPVEAREDLPVRSFVGAPQVNLGPQIYPLPPSRQRAQSFETKQLKAGFPSTREVRMASGQRTAACIVGHCGTVATLAITQNADAKTNLKVTLLRITPSSSKATTWSLHPTESCHILDLDPVDFGPDDLFHVERVGSLSHPLKVTIGYRHSVTV